MTRAVSGSQVHGQPVGDVGARSASGRASRCTRRRRRRAPTDETESGHQAGVEVVQGLDRGHEACPIEPAPGDLQPLDQHLGGAERGELGGDVRGRQMVIAGERAVLLAAPPATGRRACSARRRTCGASPMPTRGADRPWPVPRAPGRPRRLGAAVRSISRAVVGPPPEEQRSPECTAPQLVGHVVDREVVAVDNQLSRLRPPGPAGRGDTSGDIIRDQRARARDDDRRVPRGPDRAASKPTSARACCSTPEST